MVGLHLEELRLSLFGFTQRTHVRIMPGLKWSCVKDNLGHLVNHQDFRRTIRKISLVMVDHPLVTSEDKELALRFCEEHNLSFNFWGFLDRSGNVERYSNEVHRPIIIGCEQNRPLERMHITFTGDVILCCQDWRWHNVIGNVKRQSLLDIWNSDKYQEYRERIYAGIGEQPGVCTRCKLSVPAV
jgi:radical SAM protein with 4Fe4S-binding SPASM domain